MPVTFELMREFAKTQGDIRLTAPKSVEIKILKSGEMDIIELVEKATDFLFGGKHYRRQEFERLLSDPAAPTHTKWCMDCTKSYS